MLDVALIRLRQIPGGDLRWYVPYEREPLALRLVRNCPVQLRCESRIYFDIIDAVLLEYPHLFACLRLAKEVFDQPHFYGSRPFHQWTCNKYAWPGERPGFSRVSQTEDVVQWCPHIADGCDSGGEQLWEVRFSVFERTMQVVVPQAGNQEFSSTINDLRAWGRLTAGRCDLNDFFSLNDNGGMSLRWMVSSVDDGDVHDGGLLPSQAGTYRCNRNEEQEEQMPHHANPYAASHCKVPRTRGHWLINEKLDSVDSMLRIQLDSLRILDIQPGGLLC